MKHLFPLALFMLSLAGASSCANELDQVNAVESETLMTFPHRSVPA